MKNLGVIFLFILAVSCAKETSTEQEQGSAISLNDALTSKKWMITSLILTTSDGGFVNIFALNFRDCEKDDLLEFRNDGIFGKTDGLNICSPLGNSVFNNLNGGSWASGADSVITITQGFNSLQYKATNWSATTMKWIQTQTNYLGLTDTYTYQLVGQ